MRERFDYMQTEPVTALGAYMAVVVHAAAGCSKNSEILKKLAVVNIEFPPVVSFLFIVICRTTDIKYTH
jgi:hypothetical protein